MNEMNEMNYPEDFYGKIRMTLTGEVEVFNGSEYVKVPLKQKSYILTEEELLEQEIIKMKGEIS